MKSLPGLLLFSSVFMTSMFITTPAPTSKCPPMCVCDMTTIECRMMKLRKIPVAIPTETTNLDLASNLISVLWNTSFTGLTSLKELVLSKNAIKYIDSHAFNDLTALSSLDLSNNDLGKLNADHFLQLRGLRKLWIGWNPLLNVTDNAFQNIPTVKEINAEGNLFSNLYNFSDLRFLKILNLAWCRVRQFDADNFRQLPRLQQLKLSMNSLEELPNDILRDLGGLQKLLVNNNLIRSLERYDFQVNSNLTEIDLANNEIQSLDGVLMGQLSYLKSVNLSSNDIETVSEVLLDGIPRDSLLVLRLDSNPINCDCRMKPLVSLVQTTKFIFNGFCATPKSLYQSSASSIDLNNLLCSPKMRQDSSRSMVATSGDTLQMTCPVEGDPSPEITWYYHNQSTANDVRVAESFIRPSPDGAQVIYDKVTFGQSGLYICQGTNARGSVNVSLALAVVPMSAVVIGERVSCRSGAPIFLVFLLLIVIVAAALVTCIVYRRYVRVLRAQRNMDYSSLRETTGEAI